VSSIDEIERHLSIVEEPTGWPITLAAAKKQIRQEDVPDDDEWIETEGIPAAAQRAEHATRRQLILATWDWKLDGFPCGRVLTLPRPPLQSVTWVKYLDTAGVEQTFAASNYRLSKPAGERCARGRLALVSGASWPSTADEIDAVTIRFVAGYGAGPAAVPPRLRMAMLRDLAALYAHREEVTMQIGIAAGGAVVLPDGAAHVYRTFKSW
jgi:uncharacterized phiE125 gp8 family phage protein